jgi:hypothetical protein
MPNNKNRSFQLCFCQEKMQDHLHHHQTYKRSIFISQIVYPEDLLKCREMSFLIGWNNEQFECTIAGFIPISRISTSLNDSYQILIAAINLSFDNPQFLLSKEKPDAKQPIILGIFKPQQGPNDDNLNHLQEFQRNGIWINLTIDGKGKSQSLKLQSIFSLGFPYETISYLIEYKPHDCNQFYSTLAASSGNQEVLFPIHSLTLMKQDLSDFQQSTISALLFHKDDSLAKSTADLRNTSKNNNPSKSTAHQSTKLSHRRNENLQLIIQQIDISSDLLLWVRHYLTILLKEQKPQLKSIKFKDDITNFLSERKLTLQMYEIFNSFASHFIYLYFLLLKLVYHVINLRVPFLETVLYFCNWNEIAPAQVTLRNYGKQQQQQGIISPELSAAASSSERFSEALNLRKNLFSSEYFFTGPSSSGGTNNDFGFYRYSFFCYEIYQNIFQFQQVFFAYFQLFSSWTQIPQLTDFKHFYHKFSYFQIYHSLSFIVINSLLGYLVSRYFLSLVVPLSNSWTLSKENIDDLPELLQRYHVTADLVIQFIYDYKKDYLDETLFWISLSPIGIKLNSFIIEKYNIILLRLINGYSFLVWNYYYSLCFSFIFYLMTFFPWIGLTYQISLVLDILMILSFPITFFHNLLSFVLKYHRDLLYSLWLFFHGKKYNIFRNRVDTYYSHHYASASSLFLSSSSSSLVTASSQLLFGILLFSIMFFLLPNNLIYYCLFLVLRLQIICIYFFLWNSLMVIKKFPFLYFFYYFKDFAFFTNRFYLKLFLPKDYEAEMEREKKEKKDRRKSSNNANIKSPRTTSKKELQEEELTARTKSEKEKENEILIQENPLEWKRRNSREILKHSFSNSNLLLAAVVAAHNAENKKENNNNTRADSSSSSSSSSKEKEKISKEKDSRSSDVPRGPLIEKKPHHLRLSTLQTDNHHSTTSFGSVGGVSDHLSTESDDKKNESDARKLIIRPASDDNKQQSADNDSAYAVQSPKTNLLRNRKQNLMMSLTEKYRKEDEEEETQRLLMTSKNNKMRISRKNYSFDREEEESQQTEDDWNQNTTITTAKTSSLSPPEHPKNINNNNKHKNYTETMKKSSSQDHFWSSSASQVHVSLSELSDIGTGDKTPRNINNQVASAAEKAHQEPSTVEEQEESQAERSYSSMLMRETNAKTSSSSALPIKSQSTTILMKLLPQPISFPRLLFLSSVGVFFHQQPPISNNNETQFSRRLRVFILLKAIYFSQPLNLIFKNNRFMFSFYETQANLPSFPPQQKLSFSDSSANIQSASKKLTYWEILSPKLLREEEEKEIDIEEENKQIGLLHSKRMFSQETEGFLKKEKRSTKAPINPYLIYYRSRILFHILLVYSLYVVFFLYGCISLVRFQYSFCHLPVDPISSKSRGQVPLLTASSRLFSSKPDSLHSDYQQPIKIQLPANNKKTKSVKQQRSLLLLTESGNQSNQLADKDQIEEEKYVFTKSVSSSSLS